MKCRMCGSELPEGALFCGECGSSVTATRVRPPSVADSRPSDTSIVEPLPKPAVVGRFPGETGGAEPQTWEPVSVRPVPPVSITGDETPAEPIEQSPNADIEFTFAFSTGESATISGSGLLGRRPVEQPGENIDRLVSLTDPGRSVSKTHLEFGLEGDELWVCDRYSGNGTIVRPLGGIARQLEPGRRYRVARGTRVEIGDQYFDVS